MKEFKLFDAEYRLMELIWENEPINSTELVRLCKVNLDWKKSTVYTMVRKLSERKILENKNTLVSAIIKKDQVQKYESEKLLKKNFNNSLPIFLAAFLDGRKLSKKEAEELKKMIDNASGVEI